MLRYQFDMEVFDLRFDGKNLWVAGDNKVIVVSYDEPYVPEWQRYIKPVNDLDRQHEIDKLHVLLLKKPEQDNGKTLYDACAPLGVFKEKTGLTFEAVIRLGSTKVCETAIEAYKNYAIKNCSDDDTAKSEMFFAHICNSLRGQDFAFFKLNEENTVDFIEGKTYWPKEDEMISSLLKWGYQFVPSPADGDLIVYGTVIQDRFEASLMASFKTTLFFLNGVQAVYSDTI